MSHEQTGGPSPVRTMPHTLKVAPSAVAPDGTSQPALAAALRLLGADRVLEELRTQARFGARCRRRATVAFDQGERAAWATLAAVGPRAVERRLERDGLIRPGRDRERRRAEARRRSRRGATSRHPLPAGAPTQFGTGAERTPFQEQLAELALALAEAA